MKFDLNLKKITPFVLAAVTIIYFIIGIFPYGPIETDSMAIASSVQHMINTGVNEENLIGHSYHMQSGTYFLINIFTRIFGNSTFFIYSVLSGFFTLLFITLSAALVSDITRVKFIIVLLTLILLFQSVFTLAYYPNSTAIAAAFWLSGFLIILKTNSAYKYLPLAAILLSLGAWVRVDILFYYPSILFLVYLISNNILRSIYYSIYLGVAVITLTLLLMHSVNASLFGFLHYAEDLGGLFTKDNNLGLFDIVILRSLVSTYSIIVVGLIIYGFVFMLKQKKHKELFFVLSGLVFFFSLGAIGAVAPKHLTPQIVFLLLPVAYSVNSLVNCKKASVLIFALTIFFVQYIIGLNIQFSNLKYANKTYAKLSPEPVLFNIFERECSKSHMIDKIQLRLGAGTKIPSADEILLSSGIIFNPISYNVMKGKAKIQFKDLINYIDNYKDKELNILVTDGSTQFAVNALLSIGYNWVDYVRNESVEEYRFVKKDHPNVTLHRITGFEKNNPKQFADLLNKNIQYPEFIAVFIWDWQIYTLNEKITGYTKISEGVYFIDDILQLK